MNRSASPPDPSTPDSPQRVRTWSLWIDGVGGFAIILGDRASIGRMGCDVDVVGDVSRHAGSIVRRGEDWHWSSRESTGEPNSEVWLPESSATSSIEGASPTPMGTPVPVGGSVQLTCRRPSRLSSTIRLDIRAPHRFDHSIDAVFVGDGMILIGPGGHVSVPLLEAPLVLKPNDGVWQLRRGQHCQSLPAGEPTRFENLSLVMQPWVSSAATPARH